MGKWIAGLIAAILAGLTLMVLEKPVKDYFTGDGLNATIVAGPWAPFPAQTQLILPTEDGSPSSFERERLISNNNAFGRMTIINNGRSTITDARIFFSEEYLRPFVYIPNGPGRQAQFIRNASEVALPNFRPGDSVELLIWQPAGLGYPLFTDKMRTVSSGGPFRIRSYTHSEQGVDFNYNNFVDFIYEYIREVIIGILIILVILFLISEFVGKLYYRRLLSDEDFYLEESVRYESESTKFIPDYSSVTDKKTGKS